VSETTGSGAASASVSGSPSTSASASAASSSSSSSNWLWLLLALLLIAGGIAWYVLAGRARSRKAWAAQLDAATGEARWLSTVLVPTIEQAATDDERRGAWAVARPRVVAAQDRLALLRTSAPDEMTGVQIDRLSSGVTGVRESLDALSIAATPQLVSEARGALGAANRQLADALPPVPPPPPSASPPPTP
jgi:hypothetical protein